MPPFRPGIVWTILNKEFREALRDRRTLVMMVLLPFFLYPALSILGINLLLQQESSFRQRPVVVAVRKGERLPALESFLQGQKGIHLVRVADPDRALAKGQIQAALDVQPGAADALKQGRSFRILVRYDQADYASLRATERLEARLKRFERQLLRSRLQVRRLPPDFADPVQITRFNVASAHKLRGFLIGGVIPAIMIMMLLLGGFYPAIDLTAGERERSTLETLMTAPISRLEIASGKFLAVFVFMLLTGVFNLISLGLSTYYILLVGAETVPMAILPPIGGMILILVLLVPTAWLFSGVLLAVASLARGFKDAQHYLTPLYLVCSLPALAAMIPGFELNRFNALVPVVNIALLSRQLLIGEWDAGLLFLTLGSDALYAAAAVVLAARLFHHESLLTEQNLSARLLWQGGRRTPAPLPAVSDVLLFLLLEFILLYYLGGWLQTRWEVGGLVLTQWGLFALPVLVFLRQTRAAPEPALGLRPCGVRTLLGAACLAAPLMLMAIGLLHWQSRVLPVPSGLEQELMQFARAEGGGWHLAAVLFALAISPAICEEMMFRGVVLRSFQAVLSPAWAVVASAILFGLFHLSLYRFLPTAFLGVVLGIMAIATHSLFPGMVLHGLYNGIAVLVANAPFWGLPEDTLIASPWLWPAAVLLALLGGFLLARDGREKEKEAGFPPYFP